MENYINTFFFTYFPHISLAIFWFGVISRFAFSNKSIQAKSTQLLAGKGIRKGSNWFHYGIIIVFFGHLSLFLPEELYHLIMTTETKRLIALVFGSLFGTLALIGMFILIFRRIRDLRVRKNSHFHDYFILLLLILEAAIGMCSVSVTATGSISNYAALGEWAQKIITFQPDAGSIIAGHSILYKIHIIVGLFIFMIFPYTKLMHILIYPFTYIFRSGYQLLRRNYQQK